jgi:hypothetical protein
MKATVQLAHSARMLFSTHLRDEIIGALELGRGQMRDPPRKNRRLQREPGTAARRGTYCGCRCSAMKSMNALSLGVIWRLAGQSTLN